MRKSETLKAFNKVLILTNDEEQKKYFASLKKDV